MHTHSLHTPQLQGLAQPQPRPPLSLNSMSSPPSSPSSAPASPPGRGLVTRIKPVTSPRTSMKLLALQHYANVYAAAQRKKTEANNAPPSLPSPSPSPPPLPAAQDNPKNDSTGGDTGTISMSSSTSVAPTSKTNIANGGHVEAALELPFNPASGSEVTRFEELGDSGQFRIFP